MVANAFQHFSDRQLFGIESFAIPGKEDSKVRARRHVDAFRIAAGQERGALT